MGKMAQKVLDKLTLLPGHWFDSPQGRQCLAKWYRQVRQHEGRASAKALRQYVWIMRAAGFIAGEPLGKLWR